MKVPYIGFGNEQLEKAKPLSEFWECPICHEKEKIEYSVPLDLQFVRHKGKLLLIGIYGKDISCTPTLCHGELDLKGEIKNLRRGGVKCQNSSH